MVGNIAEAYHQNLLRRKKLEVRRHHLVQRNDSWPSIIFYPVNLVKGPRLISRIRVRPQLPLFLVLGGSSSLPTIDPDLFSFVLGITKPSLAFVNHTKAEHPTMAYGKAPLRVRLVNPARDAFVDKTAVGMETFQ